MKKRNYEPYVFFLIALIYILYIWSIPIFVTQDGPSHLYNSKIILDLILNNESEFYLQYLDINNQVAPNWFSNILMSFLVYLFSPVFAEKIFISLLVLALPLSFRYAMKSINHKAIFLSSLVFVLSNGFFLIYGFYNFQWSLVFFCMFIGYYIRSKETLSIKQTSILSTACLLIFFTHPVAFVQIAFLLGLEIIRNLILFFKNQTEKKNKFKHIALKLGFIMLVPGVLFVIFYTTAQNDSNSIFNLNLSLSHIKELLFPHHLLTFSTVEKYLLSAFSLLVFIFFGLSWLRKSSKINSTGINLLSLLFLNLFIYFFIKDELAGGAYLIPRTTIYIYIILLLFAGTSTFQIRAKQIYLGVSVVICISFLIVRYPYQKKIGEIAENYIELRHSIKNQSTVLPLSFSNRGEINSTILSPRLSVFKHISGYLGSYKQLISFDNYEANTNYFPLIWKDSNNPYKHLSRGGASGIELNPPSVDITSFNNRKGCNIDYILLFGDAKRFSNSEEVDFLYTSLEESYQLINKSDDNLSKLYIKNSLLDSTKNKQYSNH